MIRMSDYQIGAFEALEWAWHILREYDNQSNGIEDARNAIREKLSMLGNGDKIQFKDIASRPLVTEELVLARNL